MSLPLAFSNGEKRMAKHDIQDVLLQSFIGALPDSARCDLAASARVVDLPAGRLIYDPQLSIIMDGTLRAFVDDGSGRHLTVSYMHRPRAIGIASAAGREFPVAFQAVTATIVLRIPLARFDEIRHTHPEVGWAAARELARCLDDVLAEITRVAFQPVRARIAHHLLELTDSEECEHPVHQSELAASVGSVREVVSRTVGPLRDAGLVDVSQSGITAVNEDGLRQVAAQRE
jgi:CRP/FNR family transcriptional regulator